MGSRGCAARLEGKMRLQHKVWCLLALSACDSWFGKNECTEGEQRCDGNTISTCSAMLAGAVGNTQAKFEWKKTNSCSVQNEGLVCHAEDGFAACVAASRLDAGLSSQEDAQSSEAQAPYADPSKGAEVVWTRVDVAAREDGTVMIANTKSALLGFAPPSPAQGHAAAVSYGKDDKPLSAALLTLSTQLQSTAWVRTAGATRVSIVGPDGRVLDSRPLAEGLPATPKSSGLAQIRQSLSAELPPTLEVVAAGTSLLAADDSSGVLVSVPPTPELLGYVGEALRGLPPFAASAFSKVAFVASPLRAAALGAYNQSDSGVRSAIELADGEDDDLDGGILSVSTDAASPTIVSGPAAGPAHVVANQQAVLYVDASPSSLADYARDPNVLAFELAREVASLFVRFTSPPREQALVGFQWAFPADYPAQIAALIKERMSPLLMPAESLVDVWRGLHEIGVRAKLASPYAIGGFASDESAVQQGFSSAVGGQGAAEDFVEYVARANVPDVWMASPCAALRNTPLDQLDPKLFVHLAKLETAWGIGVLSGTRLKGCVGTRALEPGPSGIVVHGPTREQSRFDRNVLAQKEPFYHGQTQVALTADQGAEGHEIAASFTMSTAGPVVGLFRLTSVSDRADPEIGAGFYFSKASTYERAEAVAGLLLITRVDTEQIAGHALMVLQGVKKGKMPFAGTTVMPLITTRYDIPKSETTEASE
jgi:hypothetical protein